MEYATNQGQQPYQPQFPEYGLAMAFAQRAILAEHNLADATVTIQRLKFQVNQQLQAEGEYKDTAEQNGCTVTWDKYGRTHLILNDTIDSAQYVVPNELCRISPWYHVRLRRTSQEVLIDTQTFEDDKKLLHAFQILPGIEIQIAKTQRRTAQLLRNEIFKILKHTNLEFYTGWQPSNTSYCFRLFSGEVTHQRLPQIEFPIPHPSPVSTAVAAAAAAQYWPVFQIICDPFSQWLVTTIFHIAALHTLLGYLDFQVPLAFALFSDNIELSTYLRAMLCWFGDGSVTLNEQPNQLVFSLLSRRDQPIVVVDKGRLNHMAKSMSVLEEALTNGTVTWKIGKEAASYPLQGTLVILSDRPSALTCAPETMLIDIPPNSFDRNLWLTLEDRIADSRNYHAVFIDYVEGHLAGLREALRTGHKDALQICAGNLNERCSAMLSIFLGMDIFLSNFFSSFAPAIPPVAKLDKTMTTALVNLLHQTTDKELCTSLVEQFLLVGRNHIEQGTVQVCPVGYAPKSEAEPTIYYDREYLHFNPAAFFQVCNVLPQSRPSVLHALAEAGLFGGRQVNSTTAQTRITVFTVYGQSKSVKVYAISREAFDNIRMGEPLILEAEEL